MTAEAAIYQFIKSVVPESYRYKAPTPNVGDYVVLDFISDVTPYSKDIAEDTRPGNKIRAQVKSYSSDNSIARQMIDSIEVELRKIDGLVYDNVLLKAANDAGVIPGYSPTTDRYSYILDFTTFVKVS